MPVLPELLARDGRRPDHGGKDLRAGFSLDVWLKPASLQAGQAILIGDRSRFATAGGMRTS